MDVMFPQAKHSYVAPASAWGPLEERKEKIEALFHVQLKLAMVQPNDQVLVIISGDRIDRATARVC